MVAWSDYKQHARERGSLAFELFVVTSTAQAAPETLKENLPAHLAYQAQQESLGNLVLAGPLSDETGEEMQGTGLIIYRAKSMQAAREIAANDPMHVSGARSFTLRRWLVNEGCLEIQVKLSQQKVTLS